MGTPAPSAVPTIAPTPAPTPVPTPLPTPAPSFMECWDLCTGSLDNVTAEVVWAAGGILTEIKEVVDTLEPDYDLAAKTSKLTVVSKFVTDMSTTIDTVHDTTQQASDKF